MSRALLLIHGFLTGPDDWNLFVPELRPMYDELILFKQPGHSNRKTKPDFKYFNLQNCYESLDSTISMLAERYDEVDVMGHSMGGCMGIYAATKLPNIRRLVLLAPAVKFPRPGAFARHSNAVNTLKNYSKLCKNTDSELSSYLGEKSKEVKKNFEKAMELFLKRLLPNWSPHNLMTLARVTNKGSKAANEVKCPVAVMWGELDEFVSFKAVEYVMNNVQSKEKAYVKYDTVGHAMMYIGDINPLMRDIKCFLAEGDVCDIEPEQPEWRTAVSVKVGEDNNIITRSREAKIIKEKDNVRMIVERTESNVESNGEQ